MDGMDELRMLADGDRLFSTEAARRAGYRHADLTRLARDGYITSVHQGWYALGSPETQEDLHRLRTAAAERRHGGRALASHYSELIRLG